jgi:hypothetical protein
MSLESQLDQIREARIIEHKIGYGYDPSWLLKKSNAEEEVIASRVKVGTWLAAHGWDLVIGAFPTAWSHPERKLEGFRTSHALIRTAEWLVADILVDMGWAQVNAKYGNGDVTFSKFIEPGKYTMRKGKPVCLPGAERHRIQYAARLAGLRTE